MYPESSRKDIIKNMQAIKGTNPRTPPTPPIIPSTTRDWAREPGISDSAADPACANRVSSHPMGTSPTVNVTKNRRYITAAMNSGPKSRCVNTLSIRSDRLSLLPVSPVVVTHCLHTERIKP